MKNVPDPFKPNQKYLIRALEAIPNVTLNKAKKHLAVSKGDYTIFIHPVDGRRMLSSYKTLWDEAMCAVPTTPAHFLFRYEVSTVLGMATEIQRNTYESFDRD